MFINVVFKREIKPIPSAWKLNEILSLTSTLCVKVLDTQPKYYTILYGLFSDPYFEKTAPKTPATKVVRELNAM